MWTSYPHPLHVLLQKRGGSRQTSGFPSCKFLWLGPVQSAFWGFPKVQSQGKVLCVICLFALKCPQGSSEPGRLKTPFQNNFISFPNRFLQANLFPLGCVTPASLPLAHATKLLIMTGREIADVARAWPWTSLLQPGPAHSHEADGGLGDLDIFQCIGGNSPTNAPALLRPAGTQVSWEMGLQALLFPQWELDQANSTCASCNQIYDDQSSTSLS